MIKNYENNIFYIDFLNKKLTINEFDVFYTNIYFNKDYNSLDNFDNAKRLIDNFMFSLSEKSETDSEHFDKNVDGGKKENEKNISHNRAPIYKMPLFLNLGTNFINLNSFIVTNVVIIKDIKTMYQMIFPNTIVNIYILLGEEDFNSIYNYIQTNKITTTLLRFKNFESKYIDKIISLQDKINEINKMR